MNTARVIVIILDSVGIGAAPDAADYNDAGANTLANLAEAVGGLRLPTFEQLGLGNIPALLPGGRPIAGVPPVLHPEADYGAMRELSVGKDTTTGHWEIAGLHLTEGFTTFPPGPPSFPAGLLKTLEERTGRGILGNKAASGTAIIEELGAEQLRTGNLIVYTSADSVMQIAAHEDVIPVEQLYAVCAAARELCNPLKVGRVIARPYTGQPGRFQRTSRRKDYSLPPPEPFIMENLQAAGIPVHTIGKLDDIYDRHGISNSRHTTNNHDSQQALLELIASDATGLILANFIDFDMLYGHRRDARGYSRALQDTDAFLSELLPRLKSDDRLVLTADHGNDPTFSGTDHTREYVPLLSYTPQRHGRSLGIRQGFFDIAQTLAGWFRLPAWPRGVAFDP
ncbi:MAG: phosphopentomutase [Kiritimatiellia bacterium]